MDPRQLTTDACLDVAEVMLLALDPDGRIRLINRKGCQILGYTSEALIGQNWFDHCLPESERASVRAIHQRIMAGDLEPNEYVEGAVLARDGTLRQIVWHNMVLKDDSGRILASFSSGEDVTERREAEESLRVSEARFRTLAEKSIDVPYQLDPQGHITYVGPQVERYGYDPDDLLSHHISEVLHPQDEERALQSLVHAVETGTAFCDRYRVIDNLGRVVWMEAGGRALRDETGSTRGITGILRDVTERVQVEEVLRESEERLRKIFEDGPIGMTIAGRDFRFLMANDAFCRMVARREADLTMLTFRDITHPEDLERDVEGIQSLLDGAIRTYSTEKRYLRPSGEIRWGKLTLSISRDRDGLFLNFLAMIEDITARKAAELAAEESEERYRHLIDSSSDWVWEVDATGTYTYVSPRVRDVLGYEPEEIIGRDPFDLMPPDEAERVGRLFGSFIAEQREFRGLVNANIHKDGRLVILETNGVPWFDDKGRFGGYRGMDRDITERTLAEDALRSALMAQRRSTAVIEASEDAIFWASMDAVIQSWNAGAERMLGYSAGEVIGRPLAILIPPEKRHLIDENRPHLESGRAMDFPEVEVVRKDGRRILVSVKGRPVIDGDEPILAVFIREIVLRNRPDVDCPSESKLDSIV